MIRLALVLILFSTNIFAENTRALLNVVDDVSVLNVGETYSFKLTLVPFSVDSITQETFEGKTFIDFFYVTKIEKIFVSSNNQEAVVVMMKAVLAKEFQPKPIYIWNLIDRNIPVEMASFDVQSSKGQIQEFKIQATGQKLNQTNRYKWIVITLILIGLVGIAVFIKFRKRKIDPEKLQEMKLKKMLISAKTHEDFEDIFKIRSSFYEVYKNKEDFRSKFNDLLQVYRTEQFSNLWKDKDLSELIDMKEKLIDGEELGS